VTTSEVRVSTVDLRAVRAELLAAGLNGRAFTKAYAEAVDEWLRPLLAVALDGRGDDGVALLAVGGYGRSELSPASDLDLVLLHERGKSVGGVAEALWYPVWDAGFHLDHSVRTPKELVAMAAKDLKVAMGLLTARPVAGDTVLAERALDAVRRDWASRPRTSLGRLQEALHERWLASGDVAFLLEPDLKQSRGGLRDVEALAAAGLATPIAVPAVEDPAFVAAHDTLLAVRVALHTTAARRGDTLLREDQAAVADRLGMPDRWTLAHTVASAGRRIAWAAEDTWDRIESSLTGPGRRGGRDVVVEPDVVLRDGEMAIEASASPALDDSLPFRVAAAAARDGVPVARETLRALAVQPPAPSTAVRWSEAARHALVSLLGSGPAAVRHMESLDTIGVLHHYLPEWNAVRNRPQRDAYHVYTVDRHLLEAAAQAAPLVRRVHRPDLLLIGALLHDIGKGDGGDHTAAGVRMIDEIARRMAFDDSDVEILRLLVRDHLLLAETATRRDLDDPATIETVAVRVGTPERLELLAALTEADALATGPTAWSAWKADLVTELVARTRGRLAGAATAPPPELPTAAHRRLMANGTLQVVPYEGDITVVAPDRPGLLAVVAGTFTLHRIGVRSALAASEEGMAVDVFHADMGREAFPDWSRLERDLAAALDDPATLHARLSDRLRSVRKARRAPTAGTDVVVDNEATPRATVVEVRTDDGPGVLYRLALLLSHAGLDIASAKVETLGHEVVDTFYVRVAADGSKLTDPIAIERLRADIVAGANPP
jgi:[protein-PII] uridylyltransferase